MPALIGLVLVLATASHGSSSSCNATGNKPLTQCYGAVGQPLFIYLITNLSGYELILKNNITGTVVFTHKNISRFYGTFAKHSIFYPNGTLQLTKAEKMHSGKYLFEIYRGSAGQFLQARTVDLFIEGRPPFIPVAIVVIILLAVLLLVIYTLYKRKNRPKAPDNRPEAVQELVYAQVTVVERKNQKGKEAEPDTVYDQVNASGTSEAVTDKTKSQGEIVYASIHT
ncbi:uncharacterized protein LOC118791604 isoform X2 [Megalops cyprinoides]|uniref:uncharacterized protein LOC118791604 isoform X2 n=1 Tax=Megalops cyprinoides TaxID=118141 RepID=UPI0018645D0E|nr:uncharacterized protein LOC118791604 isoform X2 [Megalops cyprinoides]